jgi:hypothetical protein
VRRLDHDERLGALGFRARVDVGDGIQVLASPVLGWSPHVLYTNLTMRRSCRSSSTGRGTRISRWRAGQSMDVSAGGAATGASRAGSPRCWRAASWA